MKGTKNKTESLCVDRHETINHIISKHSKPELNEFKIRPNRMGKVFHWELCKEMKFDHTTDWWMHKPESVQENDMHKVLWNVEIQTNYLILVRRQGLAIITPSPQKKKLAESWTLPFQRTTDRNLWKQIERKVLIPIQRSLKM